MIVVDTSAWIELLRGTGSPVHRRLRAALRGDEEVCVTEVVIAEILAGARTPQRTEELRGMLLGFTLLPLDGLDGFEQAAALYRACRWAGETVRSIADCLVAVPAIRAGAPVLHADRDFPTLARHTPLEVLSVS
ncbi:MAG TPA: PIN domain nuclease [Gaiella sp.]|nr:PIN domain nuclease [Gaiella sp.]